MKTMCKNQFCKLLGRIWLGGYEKQLIDYIMNVGRYELGASLIDRLLTGWTGWRGIKNCGILQNEDRGYFES